MVQLHTFVGHASSKGLRYFLVSRVQLKTQMEIDKVKAAFYEMNMK